MRRLVGILLLASALQGCGGCRREPPPDAPRPHIVSFSPALTGILFEMGLGDHLVGVSRYCVVPGGKDLPVVGDSQEVNLEAVLALDADVVLLQGIGSDRRKKVLDTIRAQRAEEGKDFRAEQFELGTLGQVREAIRQLGEIAGRADLADKTLAALEARFEGVRQRVIGRDRPRVMFLMDHRKPFVARGGTFLDEMIEIAGGVNCGKEIRGTKTWESATLEGILAARPDVLICQVQSNEAAAAREAWASLKDLPAARTGRIHIVTDRRWTIASTLLADRTEELCEMIHPGAPPAASRPAGATGGGKTK